MKGKIGIIGFPQDIGAHKRGVDMGPYAIRGEGLQKKLQDLGYVVKDYGNISCITMNEAVEGSDLRVRYLDSILSNLEALKLKVEEVMSDGAIPLVLGGDHSQSMGTISGLQKKLGNELGLLWVDAHGDFNTPQSTISGNVHGMPLAVITGRGHESLVQFGPFPGVREENVVLFGVRDLDPLESLQLSQSGVSSFSTRTIVEKGFHNSVNMAIEKVTRGVDWIHISFDMDVMDPVFCPGTGYHVPGGLTNREALYLMERIFETGKMCSIDIVETNPALDRFNSTAQFGVELAMRAFGKKSL